MNRKILWTVAAALAVLLAACDNKPNTNTAGNKPPPPKPPTVGEGPPPPPPIVVASSMPALQTDGATGSIRLNSAASYAWNALIAMNWPAASGTRGAPDTGSKFGAAGTPVWVTMRSKVEVYPGNASTTVAPHGVTLDPTTHVPTNGPDYGYSDPAKYEYAAGEIPACADQANVTTPALIVLDETTQINNNQTFAGAAPAIDLKNSKPQLIRYALKMNQPLYAKAVNGQYWYFANPASPLYTAMINYITALNAGTNQDPASPYVNFAPPGGSDPSTFGIEIKTSWRPLTTDEMSHGRFFTSTVRYYEQPPPSKATCYREGTWGLVGMHVISFAANAPWVVWSTFEQADNILTNTGTATEDADGNVTVPTTAAPTTPTLSSDPSQPNPTVTATGGYCTDPGKQLYFQENPTYGTMPSAGNICVNARWHPIDPIFIAANKQAHAAITAYLQANGGGSSPWLFYKLVAAQGVPIDYSGRNGGIFSTTSAYYSANATIETDYSLGNFTGQLVKGVPSDVVVQSGANVPYYNTRLLPFQTGRLGFGNIAAGGCAGCHDNASLFGKDFSFAIGNNVTKPEATNAFATNNLMRNYFPLKLP
ncbi:MAG TPA: hypothetical protein VII56_02195 [Rhizomicrobium sp.]